MPLWPVLSRLWPYLALAAAIIGATLWIDARGYQRAKDDRAKADAALYAKIETRLSQIDKALSGKIAAIDATERTVNTTLIREVQSNARYSDPAGLSAGIVRGINEARAASCPSGVDCGPVPAAAPTD